MTPQEDEDAEAEEEVLDPELSNAQTVKNMMSLNECYAVLRNLCTCFTPTVPFLQAAHANHDLSLIHI